MLINVYAWWTVWLDVMNYLSKHDEHYDYIWCSGWAHHVIYCCFVVWLLLLGVSYLVQGSCFGVKGHAYRAVSLLQALGQCLVRCIDTSVLVTPNFRAGSSSKIGCHVSQLDKYTFKLGKVYQEDMAWQEGPQARFMLGKAFMSKLGSLRHISTCNLQRVHARLTRMIRLGNSTR